MAVCIRGNHAHRVLERLPNTATANTEVNAPDKYHGTMNTTAQPEYSDDSAPSRTGNQYKATAIASGAVIVTAQVSAFERSDVDAAERSAEMTAKPLRRI